MNSFPNSNLIHISAMAALDSLAYSRFSPSLNSIYRYSPPMTPAFLSYSPAKFSKTSSASASCLLLPQLSSRWTSCARIPSRLRFSIIASALKKLSDSETFPVPATEEAADEDIVGTLPSGTGVYAVYNKSQELQFIGISRNVAASIVVHRKTVPEFCSAVKVGIVDEPDRAALTQAWKSWMEEHIESTGKVPPGNEKGNTTWVPAAPQSKKKPDLRLTPGRHVQLTVPLEHLVDKLVKENKVVAFIKGSRNAPQCGFSQRVIGILNSQAVDYESVDVLDEEYNHGLRDKLKEYSNWPTFPQVFVNGELVGGCDILTSMYEQGELGKLLKG